STFQYIRTPQLTEGRSGFVSCRPAAELHNQKSIPAPNRILEQARTNKPSGTLVLVWSKN
ncbi:AAEL013101-PA, partial [Aedes aegypti]